MPPRQLLLVGVGFFFVLEDKLRVFNESQVKELNAPLKQENVSERQGLSYLESWWVITEANRIFGHGNWHGEVLKLDCVAQENYERNNRTGYKVAYICTYRVTVIDDEGNTVVREDVGFGNSQNYSGFGDAHELATKEAVSDAMKRCLRTFGGHLGLWLYDKTQTNVVQAITLRDVTTALKKVPSDKQDIIKEQIKELLTEAGESGLATASQGTLDAAYALATA